MFFLNIIFLAVLGIAGEIVYLPMDKSTIIELGTYDSKKNVYELTLLREPGQGPFYIEPKELKRALPYLKINKIKRSPSSLSKRKFITQTKVNVIYFK